MPEYQDEVKHKNHDLTGKVIATYLVDGIPHLDVRLEGHICYETPDSNWETIIPVDE